MPDVSTSGAEAVAWGMVPTNFIVNDFVRPKRGYSSMPNIAIL